MILLKENVVKFFLISDELGRTIGTKVLLPCSDSHRGDTHAGIDGGAELFDFEQALQFLRGEKEIHVTDTAHDFLFGGILFHADLGAHFHRPKKVVFRFKGSFQR